MKIDLIKVLKVVSKATAYLDVAEKAVEAAEGFNSDKVYKHKDKVDKVLQGAAKALSVVRIVKGIVRSK